MLPTKVFKKRQFIYTEGETANEMYIVLNGNVKITKKVKNTPVDVATLGKGSFLGEVALFRNEKHSATAVADTDLELAVINKEIFDQQLELLPNWFQTVIRSMAERLHNAIEQLGSHIRELPSTPEVKKDKDTEPQTDTKGKEDTPG